MHRNRPLVKHRDDYLWQRFVLAVCFLVLLVPTGLWALPEGNLLGNDQFGAALTHWEAKTKNASIEPLYTCDTWNSYSLTFNTKQHSEVFFYINVSPDKYTGGTVWFDNIRGEGLQITNPSFEDSEANGQAPGWDYEFQMYNHMKRHAKLSIGTDFQQASDGQLSMRFFAPRQKNMWKLATSSAPERVAEGWNPVHKMSSWRPLVEATMVLWQKLHVEPNTDYTITMDYRFTKDFNGTIRPAVGYNMQPWGLLAHAGWQWTEFKELQMLRDRYGRSCVSMTIKDGQASLTRELPVPPDENLHLSVEMSTSRTYNHKPLETTTRLVCEDAQTGRVIAEDRFDWDGAPGHVASVAEGQEVEGASSVLSCNFVSPSPKLRIRLISTGTGESAQVILGNLELASGPQLTPPVQQLDVKSPSANFRIGDTLSYHVAKGNAEAINGALWLTSQDLKKRHIAFVAGGPEADVVIAIGTFQAKGDEGYHLTVNPTGIRIDCASPRAAQYALMTLLQLIGSDMQGPMAMGVDITDWPDMPIRGVVMESCSHFVPRPANPVRLTNVLYHDNPRQTWSQSDFLQLVRWKFNTVFWRSTGLTEKLLEECRRFHIDSMKFISTISDPPDPSVFREHPEWIEGVYVSDEQVTLKGQEITYLQHPHVLRTKMTDIVVKDASKTVTYTEGSDYRVVGEFGKIAENRQIVDNKPFGIGRIEGTRIPDGATVLVSYDYIDDFGPKTMYHRQYCLSQPEAVAYVGEAVKRAAADGNVKYLHIRGDEVTHVNSDSRCKRRGLTASQLLLEHVNFLRDKAHEGNPNVQVCMWHDSLCPYAGGYQWGFTEQGPAPPRDILQLVWYYGPGIPSDAGWACVKYYQKYGVATIVVPWYNLPAIREWAQVVGQARARGWNCLGMMDTPWGHPGPYPNFRETAIVSWKIPRKGARQWVEFAPDDLD